MRRVGARGVGERAEEVERGRRAELAAHRRGEAHRRVEALREAEPDADLAHAARHALGTEVDDDAERLEHVGRPALRRRRPTAVLGDPRARRRRSTIAAMVETLTVPAPSPPVPQVSTSGPSRSARSTCSANVEHRAHERGELGGGLALGPERRPRTRRSARRWRRPRGSPTSPVRRGRRGGRRAGADARSRRATALHSSAGCYRRRCGTSPHLRRADVRRSCGAGAPAGGAHARRGHPTRPASRGR